MNGFTRLLFSVHLFGDILAITTWVIEEEVPYIYTEGRSMWWAGYALYALYYTLKKNDCCQTFFLLNITSITLLTWLSYVLLYFHLSSIKRLLVHFVAAALFNINMVCILVLNIDKLLVFSIFTPFFLPTPYYSVHQQLLTHIIASDIVSSTSLYT